MGRINLPAGIEGVENLPRTRRLLQNCWNDLKGHIIGRPGLRELNTTLGVARGQFVWNGALYQVASQTLIKITNTTTGAFTNIGTINGIDVVETAIGFNTAVIVVKNATGEIYTLDKSDNLVTISGNSNFVPCRDVTHIDGRFVYIPFNGDPAFFSDVGAAGTVQAASFFDAEELPDVNNAVFNFKNTLYIGGTDSFELFRDTGASPNPFGRINGSRIPNGFIGGLLEYNETFLFVGREKDQDFGIYAIGQGFAPKISNEAIDLVLSSYTQAELESVISGRFKWRGYDVATFRFPNDSFGFYGGNWFRLDTIENGDSKPWSSGFVTQFGGKYYTAFDNKIGVLDSINTDYGEPIKRIIDTGFEQENNEWFTIQSVDLGIAQGSSSTAGSVALFMSRDNRTYGEPLYQNVGDLGEYGAHLSWNYPGGMGSYEGFAGIRIYTTEDVDFANDYLTVNFR